MHNPTDAKKPSHLQGLRGPRVPCAYGFVLSRARQTGGSRPESCTSGRGYEDAARSDEAAKQARALSAWVGAFGRDLPGIDFSLRSPFFGAVLDGSAQHVAGIADTTREELRALLARAFEDGLSIPA
jgi:hypothetical protein